MSNKWTPDQKSAIYRNGHNILVSAGAGSGKTAVLTERALQYVLGGKDIDHMLILTFTNAAAAQMKEKIRKKIRECDEGILSAQQKKRQLNKIDSAYIMTFDAYALFLVKKYHYLLNVSKDINIIEANALKIHQDEYLDEIMEEKYRGNEPRFEKLISDFCTKDDEKIRQWIRELNLKLSLRADRREYLEKCVSQLFTHQQAEKMFAEYENQLKKCLERIDEMFNQLSTMETGNFDTYYQAFRPLLASENYEEIRKNLEFKIPNRSKFSEAAKSLSDSIKRQVDKLRKELIFTEEQLKENYLSTQGYVEELVDIIQKLDARLIEYKSENDLYDYNDIFLLALSILQQHEDIRQEISDYFFEIMIDEYQDTNDLQDLFISLIEHDNVYMVGDIKQSIYRFRNANPDIFQKKYDSYQLPKAEVINLNKNFRSRNEVVAAINLIFDRLMDRKVGGADYQQSHRMVFGQEKYLNGRDNHNLQILTYQHDLKNYPFNADPSFSKDEVEAFIIARDIKEKIASGFEVCDVSGEQPVLRPASWKDFCILISTSTRFDLFKKILTYNQIPARIEQDEEIKGSDLLTVIKNIFKLIDASVRQDENVMRHCFVSVARSFLMEMSDERIHEIVLSGNYEDTEIMKIIHEIAEGIETKTISDILDDIIDQFEVYDRLNRIGELDDNLVRIDYLYQWAHQLNLMDYSYLQFVEYLNHIFDDNNKLQVGFNKPDIDAVKILTIHKSKGLEYPICYFPGLSSTFNDSDLKAETVYDAQLGILTPCYIEGKGKAGTMASQLYVDRCRNADRAEKIRLLYVALTRTREKIILVMPDKNDDYGERGVVADYRRTAFNCMADYINAIYDDLSPYRTLMDLNDESLHFSKKYKSASASELANIGEIREEIVTKAYPIIHPEVISRSRYSKSSGLVTAQQKKAMAFGTKMHYYLEMLDFAHPDYRQMDSKAAETVRRFMESDLMKNAANGRAYKEYEFIYQENDEIRHGFIDLLMEYDDHFDIIDYKLKHVDDDSYFLQLSGYRTYLQSISHKPVNCYLYSLTDSHFLKVE